MIPKTGISVSKKELFGLLVIFIVYVLMGGVAFMLLESPLEEQLRRELSELREEFQEKLGYLEKESNITRAEMERLMLRLAAAHSNNLIDEEGNDTHTNWSFDNSFFFAITVVTTIGYGHLSPSTTPGRLFCLVYATVGIPLTGILLAAIGGYYSDHLVQKLQKARKSRKSPWYLLFSASTCLVPWLLVFLVIPAALFTLLEGWTFEEGLYYCFITLSTIGFGDYVAGNFKGNYIWLYKMGVVLWIIFGLGYLAMILNYISRAMRCKQVRQVERKVSSSFYHTQQRVGQRFDEVCCLLQDISKHRGVRRAKALKRIQSFPAPELNDRNHNHKIQRLMNLMQNLSEDEPLTRPRRMSLPLPDVPHVIHGTQRGSLQMVLNNKEAEHMRNGFQINQTFCRDRFRPPVRWKTNSGPLTIYGDIEVPKISIVDAVDECIPSSVDVKNARQAVIDMEGLQCTRV